MTVRSSSEDYLEAILNLQGKYGAVRSIDLAHHMGYSKPSISWAVKHLQEGGYITVSSDRHLLLTNAGRAIAERVYERHRFFVDLLERAGINEDTAAMEACNIEHAISDESFQRLKDYLGRMHLSENAN